jgi:isocitrate/isopropylmalate dehydrogenase
MNVLVFEGDGIGPEIAPATIRVVAWHEVFHQRIDRAITIMGCVAR